MGADTPHVELTVLLDSFRLLDDNDVVVGRATDGGYYLLGLRSGWDLVADLDMGSRDVIPGNLSCRPRARAGGLNADDGFGGAE
jgi:glycosyltransferase A (GT-A) superfamily protein (DUF2064 family)